MTTSLKSSTKGSPSGARTFELVADGVDVTLAFERGKPGDLAWKVTIHLNKNRAFDGEANDRLSAFRARKQEPSDRGMPLPKVTDWLAVEQVLAKAGAFKGKGGKP